MFFKRIFVLLLFIGAGFNLIAQENCPILPEPLKAKRAEGFFILSGSTQLIADKSASVNISIFKQEIKKRMGIIINSTSASVNKIYLTNEPSMTKNGAYQITMTANRIQLKAGNQEGIFNGLMSLLQLASFSPQNKNSLVIPCWVITDTPLFEWRGLMLDEARHFFGITKVKQILDWMSFYKLNRFHWHLTDVQGWRIAIDSYPNLSTIGGVGDLTNPFGVAKYYTKQQIAEVVAYAKERNITVIPEIDMPGHATAANKAYPEFNGGGSTEHPNFTFNPGLDETYSYLNKIIKETVDLFPSKMIHLGGDEVSFGAKAWETNPDVMRLMTKHDLGNILMVENYFFKRMADSVKKLNAKVLAWDEAAEANLDSDNTILFWWRHDKPLQLEKALRKNYKVVLCPRLPLYFDFVQDSTHVLGRKWGPKFNAILDVYQFPGKNELYANKLIQGVQANVWSETIYDEKRLDFMLFPRIAALSSAAWTPTENKNETSFFVKLKLHLDLYQKAKLNYFDPFNASLNKEK